MRFVSLKFTGFLLALVLLSSAGASELFWEKSGGISSDDNIKEISLFVSLQDLVFDQENILVVWKDQHYPILSLKQVEGRWEARISLLGRYCPEGHNLCNHCGLCHLQKCRYYVPPCWLR